MALVLSPTKCTTAGNSGRALGQPNPKPLISFPFPFSCGLLSTSDKNNQLSYLEITLFITKYRRLYKTIKLSIDQRTLIQRVPSSWVCSNRCQPPLGWAGCGELPTAWYFKALELAMSRATAKAAPGSSRSCRLPSGQLSLRSRATGPLLNPGQQGSTRIWYANIRRTQTWAATLSKGAQRGKAKTSRPAALLGYDKGWGSKYQQVSKARQKQHLCPQPTRQSLREVWEDPTLPPRGYCRSMCTAMWRGAQQHNIPNSRPPQVQVLMLLPQSSWTSSHVHAGQAVRTHSHLRTQRRRSMATQSTSRGLAGCKTRLRKALWGGYPSLGWSHSRGRPSRQGTCLLPGSLANNWIT